MAIPFDVDKIMTRLRAINPHGDIADLKRSTKLEVFILAQNAK